jgi:hypothetical protein
MAISAKIFVWRATAVARRAARLRRRHLKAEQAAWMNRAQRTTYDIHGRRRLDWGAVDVNTQMRNLAMYSLFARRTS